MRSVRAAGDSWICTETRPNVSAPFHVAAICSPFAEELECYGFISGQRNRRKIGVANGIGEGEAKMPLAFGIRCRLRRSTQHLREVYSQESGTLRFFVGVDSSAAR